MTTAQRGRSAEAKALRVAVVSREYSCERVINAITQRSFNNFSTSPGKISRKKLNWITQSLIPNVLGKIYWHFFISCYVCTFFSFFDFSFSFISNLKKPNISSLRKLILYEQLTTTIFISLYSAFQFGIDIVFNNEEICTFLKIISPMYSLF